MDRILHQRLCIKYDTQAAKQFDLPAEHYQIIWMKIFLRVDMEKGDMELNIVTSKFNLIKLT